MLNIFSMTADVFLSLTQRLVTNVVSAVLFRVSVMDKHE